MKFLADINVPQSVIVALRKSHHDVLDIKRVDMEILKISKAEKRIIITKDKDFLSLAQFPKYQVPLIAIRLTNQLPEHATERIMELLKNQNEEILQNSLTIINEETADSFSYSDPN